MKVKLFSVLGIMAILLSLVSAAPAAGGKAKVQNMPANPEKILEMLIKEGKISAKAPKEAQEQAVMEYLQKKMAGGGEDKGRNPLARKQIDAAEANFGSAANNLHGRKLGKQGDVPLSTPQWKTLEGTDNLLLILVDFSDTPLQLAADHRHCPYCGWPAVQPHPCSE